MYAMVVRRGAIHLIFGPMFAGKSTELLRLMRRAEAAKQRGLLIRHASDRRFDANVLTHSGEKWDAARYVERLCDLDPEDVAPADVLFIDEGQFFPDLVLFCISWARMGRAVYVAALSGDFRRRPFPVVAELTSLCRSVTLLTAVCAHCQQDAEFSHRTTTGTSVIEIGGKDHYEALCGTCYDAANEIAE